MSEKKTKKKREKWVAIFGGRLQGVEACLLARLAGWKTLLIDMDDEAPARGLCDDFFHFELMGFAYPLFFPHAEGDAFVLSELKNVDLLLPATENDKFIAEIIELGRRLKKPVAFDNSAYYVSKSKLRSDELFRELGIAVPEHFPGGKAPYIAKPSESSGSHGIVKLETREDAERFMKEHEGENWVVEEFLEGPSYSLELVGGTYEFASFQITKIHMDEGYDCCMVSAPCPELSDEQKQQFSDMALEIAWGLRIKGIMDFEVIDDGGILKLLEIDARLPSQTPLTVYFSSGYNLFEELVTVFTDREEFFGGNIIAEHETVERRFCTYEHYRVQDGKIYQEGEHIMAKAGPLRISEDFPVTELAVVSGEPGDNNFCGIFICAADTEEELKCKREELYKSLCDMIA